MLADRVPRARYGVAADLQPPPPGRRYDCDVLVIGGGPSGAAAAYWLAEPGIDVLVVEKKHFPREKTCGDGLTPRSVRQLERHGPRATSSAPPPLRGAAGEWPSAARSRCAGPTTRLPVARLRDHPRRSRRAWSPRAPRRRARSSGRAPRPSRRLGELDERRRAGPVPSAPATVGGRSSTTARDDDRGARQLRRRRRRRELALRPGARRRAQPGLARWAWRSAATTARPATTSPTSSRISTSATRRQVVPGYGWIFPLGDGRVNVGVGLLSTPGPLEGRQHDQAHGGLRRPGAGVVVPRRRDAPAGRRPAAGCRWAFGRARVGPDYLARRRRRRARSTRSTARGSPTRYETGRLAAGDRRATRSRRATRGSSASTSGARGDLRPLLPGGPGVHHRDRPDPG